MATENFKENVSNSTKWLEDFNTSVIEIQGKQIAFVNEVWTKTLHAFENINKNSSNIYLGTAEKSIAAIQKNFESISNLSKTILKNAMEYAKQTNQTFLSKETLDKIIESYIKQVEDIVTFNQKYIADLSKQSNVKPFLDSTLIAKLKKDFETNVQLSKEQMHAMINSYNKIANPSFEVTNNFFNTLNDQVNAAVNTNYKLWSKLISTYNTADPEIKNEGGLYNKKYTDSDTKRKHESTTYNN